MNCLKSIFQKDIIYYFKYREFSGRFTINNQISDNLVQINIKFAFTVCEYILLSNFICLYIFTYTDNFILSVYIYRQFYIVCTFILYIYRQFYIVCMSVQFYMSVYMHCRRFRKDIEIFVRKNVFLIFI